MSISKKIANLASSRRLGKATNSLKTVNVTIGGSNLIASYAKELAQEMSFDLPARFEMPEAFEVRLEQYIKLLIRLRVTQVNGKSLKFLKPGAEEIVVPDFIHLLLCNIGTVQYEKRLVELVPTCDFITRDDEKVWDSFADVRRVLRRLEGKFPIARGLPRHTDGEADFMVLQVVEGTVMGHEEGIDPAFPIVAAFLETQITESVFKVDITYDHVDNIEKLIQYLVEPKGGDTSISKG